MANTSTRTLRLLSPLQTHRHWPGTELADRLGVSVRTLRRDVDRLRELGYPVEAQRGVDGGYQLAAGAALPPLVIDDDEAVALAVGLHTAAEGAVEGIAESSVRVLAGTSWTSTASRSWCRRCAVESHAGSAESTGETSPQSSRSTIYRLDPADVS